MRTPQTAVALNKLEFSARDQFFTIGKYRINNKEKKGTTKGKAEEKTKGRITKKEGGGTKEIGGGANGKGGCRWLRRCFFSALL